ncbi:MAG: sigma-70 family RNA polymerase sigma factor [Bacteroidetes bacterium]|nr:sigma-70 family RNA polymerase sigma factor [Bacteroidota bacterium]
MLQSKTHISTEKIAEEYLLVKAAQEKPEYFSQLYNKYYERILQFVYQRLDSKDTAFDVTSQVFLKAMLNLPKYQFKGVPFSAWLYRIAINELNLLFREDKVQRAVNVELKDIHFLIADMREEAGEEKYEPLLNAIAGLAEEHIQIIEMRYFEKRPFKEISQILGITENNAKVRLYRILDKLKENITGKKSKN